MLASIIIPLLYLASAVCFILGLKQLSHPRTAPKGNATAAAGMLLAVVGTLLKAEIIDFQYIIIGLVAGGAIGAIAAKRVEMTSMPQLVAPCRFCEIAGNHARNASGISRCKVIQRIFDSICDSFNRLHYFESCGVVHLHSMDHCAITHFRLLFCCSNRRCRYACGYFTA